MFLQWQAAASSVKRLAATCGVWSGPPERSRFFVGGHVARGVSRPEAQSESKGTATLSGQQACDLRLDDPSHEKELPSSSSTALGSSASSTSQEEKEPTFDGLRRTDLIRLIGQALGDLGLEVTRAALETESGIAGEASIVTDLRRSAIAGNWDEALGVVRRLAEEPPSMVGEAAALRVSLLEQKCLDLHRSGEVEAAKEVFAEIAGTDGAEDLSLQLDLSPQDGLLAVPIGLFTGSMFCRVPISALIVVLDSVPGSVTCCEAQIKSGEGAHRLLHPGDAGMFEVVLLPRSLSLDPGSFWQKRNPSRD
ncbi:wdr26 [Symbiodinium sp. CCMP2456]|nr:wdr26 [Symbiodinium sp. CCMP2456]